MTIKNLLIKLEEEFKDNAGYTSSFIEKFTFNDDSILENVLFISNKKKDYFVLIERNQEELEHGLIADLQRKILVYTRKNFLEDDFISDHYEQNSTLVIFVKSDNEEILNKSLKKIIEIEEDPYLFKKQVVLLNHVEYQSIDASLLNENSLQSNFREVVEDIDRFNEFKEELSNDKIEKAATYSLVVKLYEKLPFLNFEVAEEEYQDLQETINRALKEQDESLLELKDSLLTSDFDLGEYLDKYLEQDNARESDE